MHSLQVGRTIDVAPFEQMLVRAQTANLVTSPRAQPNANRGTRPAPPRPALPRPAPPRPACAIQVRFARAVQSLLAVRRGAMLAPLLLAPCLELRVALLERARVALQRVCHRLE